MGTAMDLTGRVYGRLTVEELGPRSQPTASAPSGVVRWWCRCACGNRVLVRAGSLRQGDTRSCGCLRAEVQALPPGQRGPGQRKDAEAHRERMRRINRAWYRAVKLLVAEHQERYDELYREQALLEGVTPRSVTEARARAQDGEGGA